MKRCTNLRAGRNLHHSHAGITLPEMMLALFLVGLLMASTFSLISQYRRSFTKQEKGSDVMHQASIFLEQLRKDIQNASPKAGMKPREVFTLDLGKKSLLFSVYEPGPSGPRKVSVVEYSWYRVRSIVRRVGDGQWKTLVEDGVSTMTWRIREDSFPASSPYSLKHRVWLEFSGVFGGKTPTGGDAVLMSLETRMFPIQVNRALLHSVRSR